MAKKNNNEVFNICDDCIHSSWAMEFYNLDYKGKPICLECSQEKRWIVRGSKACRLFKKST